LQSSGAACRENENLCPVVTTKDPHPEERAVARVSKDGLPHLRPMVRDGASAPPHHEAVPASAERRSRLAKKIPQSALGNRPAFDNGIAPMRLIITTLSAAIIALAAAAPALATTSDVAKQGSESPATPCHAYEQNPDGSWKKIGCAEDGVKPPSPAKVSTRNEGKASH
jgi:hypothetical protein